MRYYSNILLYYCNISLYRSTDFKSLVNLVFFSTLPKISHLPQNGPNWLEKQSQNEHRNGKIGTGWPALAPWLLAGRSGLYRFGLYRFGKSLVNLVFFSLLPKSDLRPKPSKSIDFHWFFEGSGRRTKPRFRTSKSPKLKLSQDIYGRGVIRDHFKLSRYIF